MRNIGSGINMEKVGDLKNQGASDEEIIGGLKEKGVPPKDINDALNREKIKSAVSADTEGLEDEMQPSIMTPGRPIPLPTEGSAPTEVELTPPTPSLSFRERGYTPKAQEITEETYVPQPQEELYSPPLQQEYSTAQGYAPQDAYGEYPTESISITDTDTMIEISEQVFSEKIKALQKQLEDLNEFKTLAETKIDNISTRLKRIEASIDNLQAAILEKVGAYGRGLEGIKKEMSMMQDSFGKMIGNIKEKSHSTHLTHHIIKKKTTVIHKSSRKKTASKKR